MINMSVLLWVEEPVLEMIACVQSSWPRDSIRLLGGQLFVLSEEGVNV